MSHQTLLDVPNISKKVAYGRDLEKKKNFLILQQMFLIKLPRDGEAYPRSAGGRDVIIVLLVTQFDAMSADSWQTA